MDATVWPFVALRIRTPVLELRSPDDDLVALAHLAAEGIHDPAAMPFFVPWARAESPGLERNVLQHGVVDREGEPARLQRWVLTREAWGPHHRDDIIIEGLDACRSLLT